MNAFSKNERPIQMEVISGQLNILMNKRWAATIFSLLLIGSFSCHGIRRKGDEVVNRAKQILAEKKADLSDKIIAHFNAFEPDTKFNKKRFEEFFGFYPTDDVKNLYCYADEIGIDHSYQFSFNCDTSAESKIIRNLGLVKQKLPDNFSCNLWRNFPWWDSTSISIMVPYEKKGAHETYWYLWYDSSKRKGYFFDFDM